MGLGKLNPVKAAKKAASGLTRGIKSVGRTIDREITRPVTKLGVIDPIKYLTVDPIKAALSTVGGAMGLTGGTPSIPNLGGSGGSAPSLTNPEYQTPLDLTASGLQTSLTTRGRTSTILSGAPGFEEDENNLRKIRLYG